MHCLALQEHASDAGPSVQEECSRGGRKEHGKHLDHGREPGGKQMRLRVNRDPLPLPSTHTDRRASNFRTSKVTYFSPQKVSAPTGRLPLIERCQVHRLTSCPLGMPAMTGTLRVRAAGVIGGIELASLFGGDCRPRVELPLHAAECCRVAEGERLRIGPLLRQREHYTDRSSSQNRTLIHAL